MADKSGPDGLAITTKPSGPEALAEQIRKGPEGAGTSGAGAGPSRVEHHFGISIARDGTWYHEGSPFTRLALVKLFSTVLRRGENGDYLLVTPVEKGRIDVEDAPFVAVEMKVEGEGEHQVVSFRTNIEEWVTADASNPIRVAHHQGSEEPSPYVLVRPGIEALIVRSVFYDLVELAIERPTDGGGGPMLGVMSSGVFFPLGPAGEAE